MARDDEETAPLVLGGRSAPSDDHHAPTSGAAVRSTGRRRSWVLGVVVVGLAAVALPVGVAVWCRRQERRRRAADLYRVDPSYIFFPNGTLRGDPMKRSVFDVFADDDDNNKTTKKRPIVDHEYEYVVSPKLTIHGSPKNLKFRSSNGKKNKKKYDHHQYYPKKEDRFPPVYMSPWDGGRGGGDDSALFSLFFSCLGSCRAVARCGKWAACRLCSGSCCRDVNSSTTSTSTSTSQHDEEFANSNGVFYDYDVCTPYWYTDGDCSCVEQ